MKNESSNRLVMFQTSLGVRQSDERKPVWFQQDPKVFTTKAANTASAVGDYGRTHNPPPAPPAPATPPGGE